MLLLAEACRAVREPPLPWWRFVGTLYYLRDATVRERLTHSTYPRSRRRCSTSASPSPRPESGVSEILELDEELKKIIERTKDVSYEDDPLGISVPVKGEGRPAAAKKKKPSGAGKKAGRKKAAKKKK